MPVLNKQIMVSQISNFKQLIYSELCAYFAAQQFYTDPSKVLLCVYDACMFIFIKTLLCLMYILFLYDKLLDVFFLLHFFGFMGRKMILYL